MKVLITGCNGLLGQKLVALAPEQARVFGSDITTEPVGEAARVPYLRLDITKRDEVREALQELRPDWIVNTAAYTNVDGCEEQPELCEAVNVGGVANLAEAVRKIGGNLLHISSDYVFDGKAGPYRESDAPNPLGVYGRTKYESEKVLERSKARYLIIRTNVLYGVATGVRPNFVHWVLRKLEEGQPFAVVTDQIGNPTLADDLATALWQLILREANGLYHLGGADFVSRYEFARVIARVFEFDPEVIQATTTDKIRQKAPRPLRSGLLWDKCRREHGVALRGVREGLEEFRRQYEALQG